MHKTTDLDNFTPNDGGLFNECPWRFGDTLTFTARLSDVLGPGLTLRLRAEKNFHLSPLQLDFSKVAEVGIAGIPEEMRSSRLRVSPTVRRTPVGRVLPSSCCCLTCVVVSAQVSSDWQFHQKEQVRTQIQALRGVLAEWAVGHDGDGKGIRP